MENLGMRSVVVYVSAVILALFFCFSYLITTVNPPKREIQHHEDDTDDLSVQMDDEMGNVEPLNVGYKPHKDFGDDLQYGLLKLSAAELKALDLQKDELPKKNVEALTVSDKPHKEFDNDTLKYGLLNLSDPLKALDLQKDDLPEKVNTTVKPYHAHNPKKHRVITKKPDIHRLLKLNILDDKGKPKLSLVIGKGGFVSAQDDMNNTVSGPLVDKLMVRVLPNHRFRLESVGEDDIQVINNPKTRYDKLELEKSSIVAANSPH